MSYAVENLSDYMKRCQNRYNIMANNMANSATCGFKRSLVLERDRIAQTYIDAAPGPVNNTGNPLDLTIAGDGYFAINTRFGVRYTRAGSFQLNERREMVTPQGEPVLDTQGQPVVITGTPVFSEDGSIYSDEAKVGNLAIVKPANPAAVASLGGSQVNFVPAAPAPGSYTIKSGYIEESNVDPLRQMTDTIELMRTFELAERMLKINQNVSERSATEIGNTNK